MEPIRLTGLASGIDTASIIESILTVERLPAVRLENDVAVDQVRLSAFNDLDIAVTDLRSKTQDLNSFLTWSQKNTSSSDSLKLKASASFSASDATYSLNATALAKSHMIGSDSQTSATTALNLSGDFTVGGELITVTTTDTLDDIRQSINDAAVNMDDAEKVFASIIDKTLVIERVETGDTDIDITDGTGTILESLGVFDSMSTIKNELQASQDLAATINNIAVTSTKNTGLTGFIGGVTLNFLDEGATTLTVSNDTETIKSLINDFIDTYNTTIELVEQQSLVALDDGSDEISNLGILQGENILSDIKIKARSIVTSREDNPGILDPAFNSLESIGIWTNGRENRLSIIDSEKFEQALTSNYDEVEDLFRDFDSGVIKKLDTYLDSLNDPIDGSITQRVQTLETSITDKLDQVDDIDRRISQRESQLFEQFARMEQAMADIQSQSGFVLNTLGAG